MAEQSGTSRALVSAIESGRHSPSVAVALRLAATLGTTAEALFGEESSGAALALAWGPAGAEDGRVWRATVNGTVLGYPIEATAMGTISHDAVVGGQDEEVIAADVNPDRTLVIAGCDPLVGILAREMAERHAVRVLPLLRSSSQALDLLRRGLIHAAGVHLTDGDGRTTNDAAVTERLGAGYRLVHQLRWETGIVTAHHHQQQGVRALLRANVRWVNREEGSAAREALDRLLGTARRPRGYGHVVRDHRAVAATVASGWAEAGICIRPAADEAQLGFAALQHESYELCVPLRMREDVRIVALDTTLRSSRFRRLIADIPGCTSASSGEERIVTA